MHKLLLLMLLGIGGLVQARAQTPVALLPQPGRGSADTTQAFALLQRATGYIFRPGAARADMDTALQLVNQAAALNQRLRNNECAGRCDILYSMILREQGENLHDTTLRNKGLPYAKAAVAIFIQHPAKDFLGYAWLERSHYSNGENPIIIEEKINALQQAANAFGAAGNRLLQATMLQSVGDNYIQLEAFGQALPALENALSLYQSVQFRQLQQVYLLISILQTAKGDYVQAVRYGLLAEQTMEAVHDSSMQVCMIYNYQGQNYSNMEQYPVALNYFKKALVPAAHYKDTANTRVVLLNLAKLYLAMDSIPQALAVTDTIEALHIGSAMEQMQVEATELMARIQLKQYTRAAPCAQNLLDFERRMDGRSSWGRVIYNALAHYYFAIRQYKEADHYAGLYAALNTPAAKNSVGKARADMYLLQSHLDAAQGRDASALENFRKYVNLRDSLFNENSARQINLQEVQFAATSKDLELSLKNEQLTLLNRNEQLQRNALAHTRMVRNATAAGGLLLTALLVLVYSRYRFKQQTSQALEVKQLAIHSQHEALQKLSGEQYKLLGEKEWLVDEMHHRVKENLQLMSRLMGGAGFQPDEPNDAPAYAAIRDGRMRVQAMALIHEQLFGSEETALIDMPAYCATLVSSLQTVLRPNCKIDFQLEIAALQLPVSIAVPVGLIINEAVANAIKHAFGDTPACQVLVSLQAAADDCLQLLISDNGRGLPVNFDPLLHKRFGMQLITTLTWQLEGTLQLEGQQGVQVQVNFSPNDI